MMEPLLETIDLDVEESNELLFRVKVEGAEQAPTKIRLVCEDNDLALMFNGRVAGPDGLIQFNLPTLKDRLKEGLYQARIEVLIENRYFAPVQFQVNFKKAIKVVAEAVTIPVRRAPPEIKVTAVPVARPKVQPAAATLKERHRARKVDLLNDQGELDEKAVLEAAKSFVRDRRKK